MVIRVQVQAQNVIYGMQTRHTILASPGKTWNDNWTKDITPNYANQWLPEKLPGSKMVIFGGPPTYDGGSLRNLLSADETQLRLKVGLIEGQRWYLVKNLVLSLINV